MKYLAKIAAGTCAAAAFGTAAVSPVACLCVISALLFVTSAGAIYLALTRRPGEARREDTRQGRETDGENDPLSKGGAA